MSDSAVADSTRADHAVWKILVVDDEPAIHQVTKLALRNLSVLGRPGQLINALSAKDAREQLEKHPDIAVVLLDVVMESESAGLDFIRHVREQVANPLVRIILRTGQPGQAPERQVMVDYDINDYKEKTELTASKLYTSVMSSIRTFGHLQSMENYRRAVEVLGQLNAQVFAAADAPGLVQALLEQLTALDFFTGIECCIHHKADEITSAFATPGGVSAQGSTLQRAQATPGELIAEEGLYAVCLAFEYGQTLTLFMATTQPLTSAALHVLDLWVKSAAMAVAHWTARA
jgi:CheY-like chemotaxis protein